MKLASYNLENLFLRVKAMNQATWAEGRDILQAHAEINAIFGKQSYSAADKAKIIQLLGVLGLRKSDESAFAYLRQNKGDLIKRPKSGPPVIVAGGRSDWIGWVELKVEEVNEVATQNTARVVRDLGAHVLGVIEAESRPAIERFSLNVLTAVGGAAYAHAMLIDGNDDRGIDVGILTRSDYEIAWIRSHVDDRDQAGEIFSRDCAEYHIRTPAGGYLVVLVNHLKSKGYGSPASSNARRKRQAARVADIYREVHQTHPLVAVIGDLNDTPGSDPLSPLFAAGLIEIADIDGFDDGGRPGTYKNGTKSNKIDFILMSPELRAKATAGGIFRMGVWGGTNGTLFPHYPEMTRESEGASDHAAIWAEFSV